MSGMINSDLLERLAKEGYLTLSQAAEELNTSRQKIRKLIDDGMLTVSTHPLDSRLKLVRRADVEAVKALKPAAPPHKKKK